jgi:hypothetical protein
MNNPIKPELQSQHLILPVGGDLLPNAVAAKLFLAKGGKVTLIHSEKTDYSKETFKIAGRLRDWMFRSIRFH